MLLNLLFRWSSNTFNNSYSPMIGIDCKIKTIELQGKTIKLQIWDAAMHEPYQSITQTYYKGTMGVMIVYDVTNVRSFDNLRKWFGHIEFYGQHNVEQILIGNKCDLEETRSIPKVS